MQQDRETSEAEKTKRPAKQIINNRANQMCVYVCVRESEQSNVMPVWMTKNRNNDVIPQHSRYQRWAEIQTQTMKTNSLMLNPHQHFKYLNES